MPITKHSAKHERRPLPNYRKLLTEKRAELQTALGINFHRLAETDQAVGDDPEQLLLEESVRVRVNRVLYDELRQVDEALERLELGEYSFCTSCGEPIAPKRLQAVPWTPYCLLCQERGIVSQVPEELGLERLAKHAQYS